eukprot:scaffold19295_cov112-Isochrysis_galbana.AAC.2
MGAAAVHAEPLHHSQIPCSPTSPIISSHPKVTHNRTGCTALVRERERVSCLRAARGRNNPALSLWAARPVSRCQKGGRCGGRVGASGRSGCDSW